MGINVDLVQLNVRKLGWATAASAVPAAIRAAIAVTATFAMQCSHNPPDSKESRYGQYKYHYDCLYHNNRVPIWKNKVLTIHAKPMVYTTVKSAHFHLPLSFLMATTVLIQGM